MIVIISLVWLDVRQNESTENVPALFGESEGNKKTFGERLKLNACGKLRGKCGDEENCKSMFLFASFDVSHIVMDMMNVRGSFVWCCQSRRGKCKHCEVFHRALKY